MQTLQISTKNGIITYMKLVGSSSMGHKRLDPYSIFLEKIPSMADDARYASEADGFSYRNFLVGAAIFAVDKSTHETITLASGNLKVKSTKEKVCAEKRVLNKAKKAGFDTAIGLVIAGVSDVELIKEVTGVPTPTLHPCHDCRGLFDEHSMVNDDTLIISVGLEEDIYQVHNFREMYNLYADNSNEILDQPTGHGFNDWNQTVEMYNHLAWAEDTVPHSGQRSRSQLAQMALMATMID